MPSVRAISTSLLATRSFPRSPQSVMSPDPPIYERGDALEVAFNENELSRESVSAVNDLNFSKEQYWTWLTALIDQGGELDQHLDSILDDVYRCQPRFYSWTGRQELRDLLGELHALRETVRAYEQDVEELWYAFAKSEAMETDVAQNADLVLESVKRTYDRAYDLCLYKFDRMGDHWVTATNLLISVTILVVTILFWMEFR